MKQFHHQKYKEIDGYDEIIRIDNKLHSKITNHRKKLIPKEVLIKAYIRTDWCRYQPEDVFHGAFCLI